MVGPGSESSARSADVGGHPAEHRQRNAGP